MNSCHPTPRGVAPHITRLLIAGLLVLAVSACESGAGSDEEDSTPGIATPQTEAPPTATATPSGDDSGEPVETIAAEVAVRPAQAGYRVGEPVVAVVGNGTTATIYVENLHTACTIGVLQRREETWVSLPDCDAERKAAVLAIAPGHGRTITMDLGAALPAGTYRIAVGWRTTPGPDGGEERRSYSDPFQISE